MSRANTSGHVGVYLHKTGKWTARTTRFGEALHLGMFNTMEEAIAAREAGQAETRKLIKEEISSINYGKIRKARESSDTKRSLAHIRSKQRATRSNWDI